jgi:hypothetical protein
MAALSCNPTTLSLATGGLQKLSALELEAAYVYFLWLQANPSNGPTVVAPAAALLKSAACMNCGNSSPEFNDITYMAFKVFIQRQRAIDSGWTAPAGTFNVSQLRAAINPLCNLAWAQLQAIEICQLAALA